MGRARTFQMDRITLHKAMNVRKINKRKEERKESRQAKHQNVWRTMWGRKCDW